ncbi:hypothetical protein [Rhizobium sp. G21]|uniref:hypothetical protein n=1 Tax=Rhizobium sp. G21 TaxID=2758439 RepID=UPI0016042872|nr:hypothetical protein [Rhizobium sp. G21]MBB1248102.1 hypothetical protein [Rhizobium sp. G21]
MEIHFVLAAREESQIVFAVLVEVARHGRNDRRRVDGFGQRGRGEQEAENDEGGQAHDDFPEQGDLVEQRSTRPDYSRKEFIYLAPVEIVDNRTIIEHKKNITEQEA